MKKKIFGGFAVMVIAMAIAWNVSLDSKTNSMTDIMLSNVEALAIDKEKDSECKTGCIIGEYGCFCYIWHLNEDPPK